MSGQIYEAPRVGLKLDTVTERDRLFVVGPAHHQMVSPDKGAAQPWAVLRFFCPPLPPYTLLPGSDSSRQPDLRGASSPQAELIRANALLEQKRLFSVIAQICFALYPHASNGSHQHNKTFASFALRQRLSSRTCPITSSGTLVRIATSPTFCGQLLSRRR